jgi:hypothetical protein
MFRNLQKAAAFAACTVAFSVPVFADINQGDVGQGDVGQDEGNVPTVLIVKIHVDKNGEQLSDSTTLIPLQMTIPHQQSGDIDVDRLIDQADSMADGAEEVMMDPSSFDAATTPDGVRQIFTDAEAQNQIKRGLNWRFYTPWGSVGNSGWYGYSYYPYHGYYNTYPNYYPRYGYYYNNYPYGYRYSGYNRRYGNYGRYYYYRY